MNRVTNNLGGIVLCGGRSSRMGRPKCLLPFGPETMLERVVRILERAVSPIVVVAAPGQTLPSLPAEVQVVHDETEYLGPLAGIAAGLAALRPSVCAAYVTACDAPLLRIEFVTRLIELLDGRELAVPHDGTYFHPLAAVYRTSLAGRADELVASGRMRSRDLIEQSNAAIIDAESLREIDPGLDSLRNINTPEEYLEALRMAGFGP